MTADPDPDSLEELVARALDSARQRAGLSVDEAVRKLRPALRLPEVGPAKSARHNWYDWRRRPQSIPAIALVAMAQLAGTSVDALLHSDSDASAVEQRVARVEDEMDRVLRLLGGLDPEPAALERRSGETSAAFERRVTQIEHRLLELAEKQEYLADLVNSWRAESTAARRRSDEATAG